MESFYNHLVLQDDKLVIQYFNGFVDLKIAIAAKSKVLKDPLYNSSLNSIIDFREANLQFDDSEIEAFIEYFVQP